MNPYQASTDESGHTSLVGTGGLNIDSHDVFLYKKFFNHSLGNGMVFQCLLQLAKIWHDIHPVACILISNCCSARFASCLDSRNIPRMFCRWLWKHRLSSSQPWSSTGGFNSSETCQGHHRRWFFFRYSCRIRRDCAAVRWTTLSLSFRPSDITISQTTIDTPCYIDKRSIVLIGRR